MAIVRQSIEIEIKCCCQRAASASVAAPVSASVSAVVVGFLLPPLTCAHSYFSVFFSPLCRIYLFLFILTFWLGLCSPEIVI